MLKATFSFAMQHGVCGLEIDAVAKSDRQAPSVELTFRVKESEDATFKDVHVGRLVGYTVWSEAPLALLLRSLHWWRVEWFSSIPQLLLAGPVRDMGLSVLHLMRNGLTGPELAALSLTKTGYDNGYRLTQSLPNRARFPMEIDAGSAVPLGAALKAVAQAQLEDIDLHRLPEAPTLTVLTDANGAGQIVRELIPYYACSTFDAYRAGSTPAGRGDEVLVPARDWRDFLAA